jgi:hypothetical protein
MAGMLEELKNTTKTTIFSFPVLIFSCNLRRYRLRELGMVLIVYNIKRHTYLQGQAAKKCS